MFRLREWTRVWQQRNNELQCANTQLERLLAQAEEYTRTADMEEEEEEGNIGFNDVDNDDDDTAILLEGCMEVLDHV